MRKTSARFTAFVGSVALSLGALAQLPAAGPVAAQPAQTQSVLRFSYDVTNGPYVRRATGEVRDWRGFQEALANLQSPPGAHGAYGLIGDDYLLGREPGYGLRRLGAVARRYLRFNSLYVVQPPGFERMGVQSGVFTDVARLNDTTLGWLLFDLRSRFEADLAAK